MKITLQPLAYFCSALLAACLLASCQTQPVDQTKEVVSHGTPYAVGSSTFFIHDKSRPYDSVAGVNVGVRSMITEIWYPVDHQTIASNKLSLKQATYGDYVFRDEQVHKLMMTQTTFFHLTPDSVLEGADQAQIDAAIKE